MSDAAADAHAEAGPTPVERAAAFVELLRGGDNYDQPVLEGLRLVEASAGRVLFRLPSTRRLANRRARADGG
jgi:hypothetical protein